MKKYTHLHPPLDSRIASEEQTKRDPEKAVETRLHQLYGAYTQPTAHKKASAILTTLETSPALDQITLSQTDALLRLHASTRERLPHYPAFYRFLFTHIPAPASIIDLGCGFNPFSLPYLFEANPATRQTLQAYHAHDIDTQQAALLNRFFSLHNLPPAAECSDLAVPCFNSSLLTPNSSLALFLKLLPVLEAQAAGSGFRLAQSLNVNHLVISYPLKSLSGKEKGMARHYRHTFETALHTGLLASFTPIAENTIGMEWVIVLQN